MNKNQWTSIGLFVFALITIIESSKLTIWEHGYPMSGLFPFVLGILLAILSLLCYRRFRSKKGKKGLSDELKSQWAEGLEPALEASKVEWRKVLFSMGGIAAYPFLFMKGGYIVGTAIFLLFMCFVVERQKILAGLIITIMTILASYAMFGLLLKVPLH